MSWPTVIYEADPFTAANDPSLPAPAYLDITKRVIQKWPSTSGRTYELQNAETGVWTPTLRNDDGLFDVDAVGQDLAAGIVPTFSHAIVSGQAAWVTAGNTDGTRVVVAGVVNSAASCTIDLGQVRWIGDVHIWHDYLGATEYVGTGNVVQVSVDGVTWTTIRDRVWAGDPALSTAAGLPVPVPPIRARYVRETLFDTGHAPSWVAFQVFCPSWKLYRRFRARTVTGLNKNLCRFDVATAGYGLEDYPAGTVLGTDSRALALSDIGPLTVAADAPQAGSQALSCPVNGTETAGQRVAYTQRTLPVTPTTAAVTYTGSVWVRSSGGTPHVQIKSNMYAPPGYDGASGDCIVSPNTQGSGPSTSLPANTWTRLSLQMTTPGWPAMRADLSVAIVTAGAAGAQTIEVGAWQWEIAGAVTAWVAPGVDAPWWTGFAERYPRGYDLDGTFGVVHPPVVDILGVLNRVTLSSTLDSEIQSDAPMAFYPCTANPPTGVTLSTAQQVTTNPWPSATVVEILHNVGSGATATASAFGASGISATDVDPAWGCKGDVTYQNAGSALLLAYPGPQGPIDGPYITEPSTTGWTVEAWARIDTIPTSGSVAVFCQYGIASVNGLIEAFAEVTVDYTGAVSYIVGSGTFGVSLAGMTSAAGLITAGTNHQYAIIIGADKRTMTFVLDGVAFTPTVLSSDIVIPASSTSFSVGGIYAPQPGINGINLCLNGAIGRVALWDRALPVTALNRHYRAGTDGFTGESAGARYARILGYSGISCPTAIDAGLSVMGPCAGIGTQSVMQALEDVVTTEHGQHYQDPGGDLTFKGRDARYLQVAPRWVLGENVGGGEIPFLGDLNLDYDPSLLGNQWEVDQGTNLGTGVAVYAEDAQSILDQFPSSQKRTVNVASLPEVIDAAAYFLARYKNPAVRVQKLTITPGSTAGVWGSALAMRLGDRVLANQRLIGQVPKVLDGFLEKAMWSVDGDTGDARVDLLISPGEQSQFMLLAAYRSTFDTTKAAGSGSFQWAAAADAAYNPLAANLPPGAVLWLEPGTARFEAVTVASLGASAYLAPSTLSVAYASGSTSLVLNGDPVNPGSGAGQWPGVSVGIGVPGSATYETRTVTADVGGTITVAALSHNHLAGEPVSANAPTVLLTGTTAFQHLAGAVVCEALPSGYTDPTVFDPYAVLDSTARLAY